MLKVQTNPVTGFSAYVHPDGRAFFSSSALVKLIGIDHKSLAKIIDVKGVVNYASEFSEVLSVGGLQGVGNLISAIDLKTIIRAYSPTSESQKIRKEQIIDALMDAGATAYVYRLCGYEVKTKETSPLLNPVEEMLKFTQVAREVLEIEDPMIKSLLSNKLKGILAETQNILPGANHPIGVVHLAEQLGYKCDRSTSTLLGKYVSARVKSLGKTGHGQYSVHVYNRGDIESHIHDYFDLKNLPTV